LLDVRDLEVSYSGALSALRGVSLAVPEGAVVAVLGANGAGKSTLLRAISGTLELQGGAADAGEIHFEGRDLRGAGPAEAVRAGIVQVPEGRRIFGELTVEENLRAGGLAAPGALLDERLESAFSRFPVLAERRRQPAGYLSGGEQQMLAIARALMSWPRLLILDEPSLGLAPRKVAEVAALIREINRDGVAILLVEQNAAMALELAGHGYVLENGKVVLDGPSAVLRQDRDVQEFYLGLGGGERKSYRDVKLYRRRKRWLS